jgi:hypothetical protein
MAVVRSAQAGVAIGRAGGCMQRGYDGAAALAIVLPTIVTRQGLTLSRWGGTESNLKAMQD